jgi:exodeoxyribonuclease VII large subunit
MGKLVYSLISNRFKKGSLYIVGNTLYEKPMNWVTMVINGQEVSIAFDENSIHIYNAYPIKDDLKLRGYRWNPADKSWYIQPGQEHSVNAEMEVLKNNLQSSPGSISFSPTPYTSPSAFAVPPTAPAEPGESSSDLAKFPKFPDSFSVSDLRNRIDRLIREGIRGNIWVRGVIASEVKNYQWASYLDLKDEDENKNIFFRVEVKKPYLEKINRKLNESGAAQSLEQDLPVFCNVEVFLPLRNVVDIRLSLLDILPEYTQAKIRNQRDITLEKLKEEGILENQKKLIVPAFISRIGLITSEQGTSIRDIKAGLHPYEDKYQFFFVDSRMEGVNAVDSIIAALTYLEENPDLKLDAVIIARGGGSEQSLAVFNDLRLCRNVCLSPLPIITAIGHEKDISALERCSWFTPIPSTPSGIGKYLQNRCLNLQEQLAAAITQLIHHFTTIHHQEMEKIYAFLKHIPSRAAGYIKWRQERLFSSIRSLEQSVIFTARSQERRIADLSIELVKKNRRLHLKSRQDIRSAAAFILSRTHVLHRRETEQVKKTTAKLDFDRQYRSSRKLREGIRKNARSLFVQAAKRIDNIGKDLQAKVQLVQASEPRQILKKGFTLTLDETNRVIKSVKAFNQKKEATLKFHDGTTGIKRVLRG